ncbi:MAG: tyrosine-type recombinase/integrase [Acidobacteria bacterium]|nr:tyrosine-type recombinase/integrase [Acidobacteriota bacterium]
MAVYKRGKTYWYKFVFNGTVVRESAKTSNRRVADQIEAARKTQLAKREVGLDVEKISVPALPDAINEYLEWSLTEHALKTATTRRYKTSSKPLILFFGNRKIDEINPDDVEKYKIWRSKQTKKVPVRKLKKNKRATTSKVLKPATINRELACLKIVLNHFIKSDVIAKNPVSKVKFLKEDNENYVVLSSEEEKLYLMAASQPLQDVATLMLESGCRPDEIYSLRKQDVNLVQDFLMIHIGKTKAARRKIPLTEKAKEVLHLRIKNAEGEYLFSGGRGGKDKTKPIVKLNNAHNGSRIRAKLRAFRLYDLRHTFASRMAMASVDLVTLAALLGHSRVQMVMRYAHPVEEHKIEAIKKLENFNKVKRKAA